MPEEHQKTQAAPLILYEHAEFLKEPFPFTLTYRNEQNLPSKTHAHDFFQLCYVIRGSCLHCIQDTEVVLCKGDIFSIPPHMYHSLKTYLDQDIVIAQIDFMPSLINENVKNVEQMKHLVDFAYLQPWLTSPDQVLSKLNLPIEAQLAVEGVIESIRQELAEQQPLNQLAVRADLLKLLVLAGREFARYYDGRADHQMFEQRKQAMYDSIHFIEEHYANDITLKEAANTAFMSPSHFSNVFKSMTGKTFVQFLNEQRIIKAQELLRNTDKKITEIYSITGFNHAGHFIHIFKRTTGVSPSDYRKYAKK
ncbi:AraC family transcriptional regulator [Paenibacillus sp. FSL H8-0034]|uniref:AraC family transcriptional regulator n=1 Tax=Paenibacillus sp. FSL H8-0034 TaxID=2954671 RepID=UPI0030FBF8DE